MLSQTGHTFRHKRMLKSWILRPELKLWKHRWGIPLHLHHRIQGQQFCVSAWIPEPVHRYPLPLPVASHRISPSDVCCLNMSVIVCRWWRMSCQYLRWKRRLPKHCWELPMHLSSRILRCHGCDPRLSRFVRSCCRYEQSKHARQTFYCLAFNFFLPQTSTSALTQLSAVRRPRARTNPVLSHVRATRAGHRLIGRKNPERPAMSA